MVIYADILLTVNWWIDFILLLGVRRAAGAAGRGWRLALGALAGAASCLVLWLPALPVWLSLLVKLPPAAAMVRIAFEWEGWRPFWRQLLWLFVLSAGLAGLCGALYFFAAPRGLYIYNGVVYYAAPPLLLVGLTVLCYGVQWVTEQLMRRRAPMNHRFTVVLYQGNQSVELLCLYDSGNHLTEPFSGRPVLVAERETLRPLMELPDTATAVSRPGWRLIPFDSLGGGGVLPAFMPERMTVRTRGGEKPLVDCYVAICDRLGQGEYRGLMGNALGEQLFQK